ncbi:aBC transporter transmembrane region [Clostridium sp. CAG:594]|nr:aBC transporter transmembrane region [Clostridium sp. CAG:594]
MIKKYFKITKQTKWILYIFIVILSVLGALNFITPIYQSKIIDALTNKNINEFTKLLIVLLALFVTTNTFSFLACKSYSSFFKNTFINIHKKVISSVYDYDDKLINTLKGRIISTVNIDIINISVMADYMFDFMHNLILIICMLIFFIKTYFIFGVFLFLITALYIFLANYLTKKETYYFSGQRMYLDKLIGMLGQTLNGIKEIKTSNIKPSLNRKYDGLRKMWANKYMEKRKYVIAHNVLLKFIMYLSKIILYILSMYLLFNGKVTIGIIILLINYFDNIFTYSIKLVEDMSKVREYNISLERVYNLLDKNCTNSFGSINCGNINGHIEFKNVSFAYNGVSTIKNISFDAKPGEITVITGKTGSGKTTIFNILLRLYKPSCGCVLIDSTKIEEYKKDTYYKNVAVVNQESFLFNMSIKDNLKMACKDEKKQIEICKKVGIHELIQSMPKGYDTILTENAANLSGGQKRLLSLAKTLLTDSKILLFDEVTSSLDIKTTNKIISILKELKDSHTVIIITHKKEVMKISDEIILLSKGRIVGKGAYKNLLKNNHFDKLVKN